MKHAIRHVVASLAAMASLMTGAAKSETRAEGPASPAAWPAPPPLEAFGLLPDAQFVTLAPGGKLIAMDERHGAGRRVVVFEADTGKSVRFVEIDPINKLRDLQWAADDTLLAEVSAQRATTCRNGRQCALEWFRLLSIRMDGSAPKVLLNDEASRKFVTGSYLLAARTARVGAVTMETYEFSNTDYVQRTGTNVGFSEREMAGWSSVVYDVDTRTGRARLLATGTPFTQEWVLDHAGRPVARSEWNPDRRLFTVLADRNGRWTEIWRREGGGQIDLDGIDAAGLAIVAIGSFEGDRAEAWAIPLDGSAPRRIHGAADDDVEGAIIDVNTNAVVGLHGTFGVEWLDAVFAKQQRALDKSFREGRIRVMERSQDAQRVLVMVDDKAHPAVYQLVDFAKGRADIVAETYPGLQQAALGTVEFLHYPARDGTPIPAYLTLPPGREARNLPLVVLPHGGPESRDDDRFDWFAQSLATRGYAVLQPQFRGSTGFGEAFRRAGYRQWGGLMQDDVTDGVKHLIAKGTADPKRVCIVGASYGGYAALAGAAFTPELYACAASVNGISYLPGVIAAAAVRGGTDSDPVAYWKEHIGPATDPVVVARSPARAAQGVRAPVLLIHGEDDTVVPIQQSETMAQALTNLGRPVTFVRLKGEDHWLSRAETRLRVLRELDQFLAKYLQ